MVRVIRVVMTGPWGAHLRFQWGASAWHRGDFILHLAGCPLVEPPCRQTFEEVARWVEDVHAEPPR